MGISSFSNGAKIAGADYEPLLMDVMNYCLEGRTSTIGLAEVKARFADADVESLERYAPTLPCAPSVYGG